MARELAKEATVALLQKWTRRFKTVAITGTQFFCGCILGGHSSKRFFQSHGCSAAGLNMRWLVLLIVDVALILLATILALFLRENFEVSLSRFTQFTPYLAATLATALFAFPFAGLNRLSGGFRTSTTAWL